MEYKVKKAVLHVLDTNSPLPVYSQKALDLSEEAVTSFIITHTKKIHDDEAGKRGEFWDNAAVRAELPALLEDFVEASCRIAAHLHAIMKEHCEIPGADLLVALVEIDEAPYAAVIKFNYKTGYTHYIDYDETGTNNKIIVHRVIFASENQKIEEGALINLRTQAVRLVEKAYELNGEQQDYFSELFLQCKTDMSQKESVKVLNAAAKEITKRYYNDDFQRTSAVKTAIYDCLETEGAIDVERIAGACFKEDPVVQREYVQAVRQAGVAATIQVAGETPERKFSKQRMKTDSGIELSMPMEVYKNKEQVEFVNNPDGTISIILKNIGKITNR